MSTRRALVAGAIVVAVTLVAGIALLTRDGDEVRADAPPSTAPPSRHERAPRRTTSSTTVATSVPSTTSTVAPTTAAPTTAAPAPPPPPPTTAPPPPPPPPPTPPPPAPAVRAPMRIMVAGDSLGFTAAYPAPTPWELPPSIGSVSMHARIGCGVLAASGATAVDTHGEGALGDCGDQARIELEGLGPRPDWMVVFSGAWEHLAWVTADGRQLPVGSPELRDAVHASLLGRAQLAGQLGVRTAFVAWVCPSGVLPHRQGAYAHWYNAILRDVSRVVFGSIVIEPTDRVCVGADAGGAPTAEKDAAFSGGHHPTDKAWLWNVWLGPALEHAR